jgi:hypothetical protein
MRIASTPLVGAAAADKSLPEIVIPPAEITWPVNVPP